SLLASAACRRILFGKVAEKGRQVACAPQKRLFRRDAESSRRTGTSTRDARATGKNIVCYFFGVGEADAAAGAPASSTAKVQCASTFFPPDFASTMTLHLSRNFFVT